MRTSVRSILAAAAVSVLAATGARARTLADVVPADAVVYVGWRGTLDPGTAYTGSHLQTVLKDSRVGDFIDQTLPAMGVAIGQRSPRNRALAMASLDFIRAAIRHPAAAFVTSDGGKPRLAVCVRGGEDSKTLLHSVQALAEEMPPDVTAAARQRGDLVILTLNYPKDAPVLAPESAASLAGSPAFKGALSHGVADPTVAAFLDASAGRALLDTSLRSELTDEQFRGYMQAMDTAGLSAVRAIAFSAGFAGKDWQTDWVIDAPAPRTGLLALSDAKPFSPDLLKRVPADAYGMSALRLDPAKLVAQLRAITAAANPQAGEMFDKGLGGATMAIGKNVTTDILEPLGEEWTSYTAPAVGGSSPLGTVIVNKLDNAFKEKQGLASLTIFLSNTSRSFLGRKGINITSRTVQIDGVSITYFGTPVISPAWAVKDGYLYAGLYPQAVLEAARCNGRSIEENEAFAQSKNAVGGKTPVALSYTDTRATLPDGYATAMLLGRTALGLNDIFLAPTNEPFLPPLGPVLAEAAPVATAAWSDDAGLYWRSHSPYPGAEGLATLSITSAYFTNVPLMTSILLPSLNRARETANRVKSASNLRQIGMACVMYVNEQDKTHALPPDLATLLATQDIGAEVFLNPRTDHSLPTGFAQMTPQQKGEWVNEHADYVWLGKGLTDSVAADRPIAYEKAEGLEDGVNILYADGHVDFQTMDEARKQLARIGVAFP